MKKVLFKLFTIYTEILPCEHLHAVTLRAIGLLLFVVGYISFPNHLEIAVFLHMSSD